MPNIERFRPNRKSPESFGNSGRDVEPVREQQSRPEPLGTKPYLRSVRYKNEQTALNVYFETQKAIFDSHWDLSVFRIHYGQVPHVVVLGLEPPAEVQEKLSDILLAGQSVALPNDITRYLTECRYQSKRIGLPWVEAHYRPGRQF